MARKKSRKGGLLAARKDPNFKANRQLPEERAAQGKGRKSGSRQSVASKGQSTDKKSAATDKRHGSKQPIPLVKAPMVEESVVVKAVPKELALEQELEALESDPRLIALLDRADEGEALSESEQLWMEQSLERISQLMDQLGIADDDDDLDDDESDWDAFEDGGLGGWSDKED